MASGIQFSYNLKNQLKTGGQVGRVRAARSEKKIETAETLQVSVLIGNMEHSQDNRSDSFVESEVSMAIVIKFQAANLKFMVVAVKSNWQKG